MPIKIEITADSAKEARHLFDDLFPPMITMTSSESAEAEEWAITPEQQTALETPSPASLPAKPEPEPTPQSTVDLDADGLPWDARIHSGSGKKTAKGVWARRKNVSDELWEQVRAELRGIMAAGEKPAADITATVTPTAEGPAIVPPPPPAGSPQLSEQTSAPPPPPPAADPTEAPAETTPATFPDLCQFASELISEKKMTAEELNTIAQSEFQMPAWNGFAVKGELIPRFIEIVKNTLAGQGA